MWSNVKVGTVGQFDTCKTASDSTEIRPYLLCLTEFWLQAADFLALETHVEEVSNALAEQLFTAGLGTHKTRSLGVPEQVLLFVFAICCGFIAGVFTV
jgi:hypothetical protein